MLDQAKRNQKKKNLQFEDWRKMLFQLSAASVLSSAGLMRPSAPSDLVPVTMYQVHQVYQVY